MRARYPDRTGYADRDGVRIFWEEYGDGEPTLLFVPGFSIVHGGQWKGQVPYFARHARVITFDGRGNGRSDRPTDPAAYTDAQIAGDIIAVLDATGTDRAFLVALSAGCRSVAARPQLHPERVAGLCLIGPGVGGDILPPPRCMRRPSTSRGRPTRAGRSSTATTWSRTTPASRSGSCARPRPSRTRRRGSRTPSAGRWRRRPTCSWRRRSGERATRRCTADIWTRRCRARRSSSSAARTASHRRRSPAAWRRGRARRCSRSEAPGHAPHGRHAVRFNLALRDFAIPGAPAGRTWTRALARRERSALFISSPIGLGHIWRDVAIARALRELVPDLRIDWLAQEPVTRVLRPRGSASIRRARDLASEAKHVDAESREHELHVFEAAQRMDEILLANFMLFYDVVEEEHYDAWIGDEAWELDYFLHENPECKRAALRLADRRRRLPPGARGRRAGGLSRRRLNAEMVEQVGRFPRVRDRAIFIGEPEDIPPDLLGPDLPPIRDWTRAALRVRRLRRRSAPAG